MDHGGDDDVPVLPGHLGDQAEVQEASDGRLWQAGRAGRRGGVMGGGGMTGVSGVGGR